MLEGKEREDALGNAFVDEMAGKAESLHPHAVMPSGDAATSLIDPMIKRAKMVYRTIGQTWKNWDRVPRGLRLPGTKYGRDHRWDEVPSGWRCRDCGKGA